MTDNIGKYYVHESKYWKNKNAVVLGLDESGRGFWAGPLVVAGCILPNGYHNDEIKDSKQLSPAKREKLYEQILNDAVSCLVVFVPASEVDILNPKQASIDRMFEIMYMITPAPTIALVDAEKLPYSHIETKSIIKGDANSISIAAASILAKVSRDRYMRAIAKQYPKFSFDKHKGYGTALHLKELKNNGPIKDFHRYSYKPVKEILKKSK
ncbi:MAG: ribonuclease HII [Malacoplasma sp.]|nr:ribonuclease HII [Malacoplasma sp.]